MHKLVWACSGFFALVVATGSTTGTVSQVAEHSWLMQFAFVAHGLGLLFLAAGAPRVAPAGVAMLLLIPFPVGPIHNALAVVAFGAVALEAFRRRKEFPLGWAVLATTAALAIPGQFPLFERISVLTNAVWESALAWVIFKAPAKVGQP